MNASMLKLAFCSSRDKVKVQKSSKDVFKEMHFPPNEIQRIEKVAKERNRKCNNRSKYMINSINYGDNFTSFDFNLVYMRVPAEAVAPGNILSKTCLISIPFKGNSLPCFV